MRIKPILSLILAFIGVAAGCARTHYTQQEKFANTDLPKPAHVWVAEISATGGDLASGSALAGHLARRNRPQTPAEIERGRKVAAQIADRLVEEIRAMGLQADKLTPAANTEPNDIVIQGHLFCLSKGNKAARILVGFGAGSSRLCTAVEAFQVTPEGLRRLPLGDIESRSGKKPGAAVSAATMAATANPFGLIVSSVVHGYAEVSGEAGLEARARQTAKELGAVLKQRFKEQGWI